MNTRDKPESTADIAVIGAGIVGICCACYLQQAGLRVALIDRDGPAEGASSGNAGHFATEQVLPLSSPGLLPKIPKMLFDPLGPCGDPLALPAKDRPLVIAFSVAGPARLLPSQQQGPAKA